MKKRTIILFVCLIFVCVLLVLNGTLFVVHDVVVGDWVEQESFDEQQIIELSGLKGKNIFTVSEKIVAENIEKAIPQAKVVNVVRSFPSTIKIVVLRRVPIIAVAYSGKYAVIDREGSVIDVVESLDYSYDITVLEGVKLTSVAKGSKIPLSDTEFARLIQIITTFETTGDNGYVGENFCKTVDKITFKSDEVSLKMVEGMELYFDASVDCTNKIRALVSFFNNGKDTLGNPIDRSCGSYTTGDKDASGKYKILMNTSR